MPRGASPEREKEYEELKERFEEEGRYKGREEEVAARIVNKQRAEFGETQQAHEQDQRGESPDRNLPIRDFDTLTIDEITAKLDNLSAPDLRQIRDYERKHRNRATLMEEIERRAANAR